MSKRYLAEIGVEKNVITTIDTAFYDMPDIDKNDRILKEYIELNGFLGGFSKVVGITISDFSWHVKLSGKKMSSDIETAMQMFIEQRKREGIGVVLIPQLFGNENDFDYLQKFQNGNVFLLSDRYNTYFQQFLISKLYAVVGMRYHSNIFSAKMGTPFIAISYEEKMRGFMELAGLKRYMLELENLSNEELEKKWDELVDTYETYRLFLLNHHKEWKDKAGKIVGIINQSIRKGINK